MAKLKNYFPLAVILLIYSSCGVSGPQYNLYGPAMYANDISYQPKPLSTDSVHHSTYASATYWSGSPTNNNNNGDEITGWQLNVGQGHTFKGFNIAYSAFAGFGSYLNQTNNTTSQPNYFKNESFGNAGGRFSANTFITSGLVDIRLVGFEMAYSHEFGDYAGYRRNVAGQTNYFVDTRTDLVTLGGTSEVVWHSRKQPLQFGLRLFLGETLGDNSYKNANDPSHLYYPNQQDFSMAYFMQIKNAIFVLEVNNGGGQLKAGLRF